jgi:hypothetical protein
MIPRPSFYTLEDLKEPVGRGGWGLTLDQLRVLIEDGQLTTTLKTIRGEAREGITAEERDRVEGAKAPRELRADARRSYAEALAVLWAYAFGKDSDALRRFTNAAELERFAAAAGFPLTRCTRTYADRFREAIDMLVAWDFLTRDEAERAMQPQEDQQEAA